MILYSSLFCVYDPEKAEIKVRPKTPLIVLPGPEGFGHWKLRAERIFGFVSGEQRFQRQINIA